MRADTTVVVGAGPAGLSAASTLARLGRPCLLVEQGPAARARDHSKSADLLSGVGGAGLFSDGKHSFFPSASRLWELPGPELAQAYAQVSELLLGFGVVAPPFPTASAAAPRAAGWAPKPYPSVYLSLEQRLELIEALERQAPERRTETRVTNAERRGEVLRLTLERGGRSETVDAAGLVVATGRWSPRWVRPWLSNVGARFAFQRVELGVRLEAPQRHPLFDRLPGVDGKLLRAERPGVELRTFCTCRSGEVLLGEAGGWVGWSGRADGPPTGRSSVGLVVRVTEPSLGAELLAALERARPAQLELSRCLDAGALEPVFGARGGGLVREALGRFVELAPELRGEAVKVFAPCVEGVGDYPADDGGLALAPGVMVAGDLAGRFRGIVASMVSGRYAALRLRPGTR